MPSGGEVGRHGGVRDGRRCCRRSVIGRSFGLLLPIDKNISYRKLSHDLHTLSILKLDGTSFDIQIARNAKVAELKQVTEEVFSLSADVGEENISWSHVWGHFCLCFEGQKLVNDKTHLQDFGIQDGDQLQFMHHVTIARNSKTTKRSKKENVACRQSRIERVSAGSRLHDRHGIEEDEEEIPMPEFKFGDFLRGWLPNSRVRSMSRRCCEARIGSSRLGRRCIGTESRPPRAICLGA